MGTVFRQDDLAFRIYPNDHIPRHVHVVSPDSEAKIVIPDENGRAFVIENYGFSSKDLKKAVALVQQNQARLLKKWNEYHGKSK
jgi:hypothetical protein